MSRWLILVLLTLAAAVGAGVYIVRQMLPPEAAPGALDRTHAELVDRFLDHLDAGDFDAAWDMFAPVTREALPPEQLARVWQSLPDQLGARSRRGAPRGETVEGEPVTTVPLSYGLMTLDARIHFDPQDRIDGFLMVPARSDAPAAVPVSNDRFGEFERVVESEGRAALAATLTLPRGVEAPPVVVLVHGSGPHDRDQSIGPNRPFRDIAHGLAERGIATLRYDKRSKADPGAFSGAFTVDLETVDDAVAAVAMLHGEDGVDGNRVFVLGHSLGAMMAPRIAGRTPVAGLVLMAPPASALQDLVMAQVGYLAGLDGEVDDAERKSIDALAAQRDALALLDPAQPGKEAMLGLPAAYWLDLAGYDPLAAAGALAVPMLVLHGARDYQVTDAEFQRWRAAFADSSRVELRQYPALNHLFIAGQGPGKPAEYGVQGRVEAQVIEDIADWIGTAHDAH
ncbi:MAG TPA: alpha/beta fold hydrolase [Xanthomonadaceae bacterium]|nr:alpha/beta fold hydrolase [Xanthomonadaceae bacterium]